MESSFTSMYRGYRGVFPIFPLGLYLLYGIGYLLYRDQINQFAALSFIPILVFTIYSPRIGLITSLANYILHIPLVMIVHEVSASEAFSAILIPLSMILIITYILGRFITLNREKDELIRILEEKKQEINTLQELIPICSYCRNIRDDEGLWDRFEAYISSKTQSEFTHGICPDCYDKVMTEMRNDFN